MTAPSFVLRPSYLILAAAFAATAAYAAARRRNAVVGRAGRRAGRKLIAAQR